MSNEHPTTGRVCNCKIGRIGEQYELTHLNESLVKHWTGSREERYSTRQLATYVNHLILETAIENAGLQYKEGEIENTYRLLTADDVSSGTRIQTRNELEQNSVDIDDVESNFVSHQTVYKHLTDCLEASMKEPDDSERLERSRDRLGALQNRTVAVTNDTVDRLKQHDVIEIGEYNVLATITITCEECQQQYTPRELFEQQSCGCE